MCDKNTRAAQRSIPVRPSVHKVVVSDSFPDLDRVNFLLRHQYSLLSPLSSLLFLRTYIRRVCVFLLRFLVQREREAGSHCNQPTTTLLPSDEIIYTNQIGCLIRSQHAAMPVHTHIVLLCTITTHTQCTHTHARTLLLFARSSGTRGERERKTRK